MAENIAGIYAILRAPAIFNAFHWLAVRKDARRVLAGEYIRPQPGDRVLDIGCGPASMLPYLGEVEYTGLDLEPHFIRVARERFGQRGTFIEARADELAARVDRQFDLAISIGVLHHLDDNEARELFRATAKLLKPRGRLIVSDPVFCEQQSPVARWIMRRDRGKSIRTREGYVALSDGLLRNVRTELRWDFMRFPYTHCISVYEHFIA